MRVRPSSVKALVLAMLKSFPLSRSFDESVLHSLNTSFRHSSRARPQPVRERGASHSPVAFSILRSSNGGLLSIEIPGLRGTVRVSDNGIRHARLALIHRRG